MGQIWGQTGVYRAQGLGPRFKKDRGIWGSGFKLKGFWI